MTFSRSYLFSSDWFPELHHNDLVHQPISCLNLFSKAKNFGASQNEGNSGSGTLETAVLFGLWLERSDFFWNIQSHPIVFLECPILYISCGGQQ